MEGSLVVFCRYPQAGQAKTRLIPALGPAGAADLQRQMTEHTLKQIAPLTDRLRVTLAYTGGTVEQMAQWLGSAWCYQDQGGGDLGARMARALGQASPPVVLIGTDCPGLTPAILYQAYGLLARRDLVLGPALDGGYYLIGLRSLQPFPLALFRDMPWSGDRVLTLTQERAIALHLSLGCLPPLGDVDYPEDLLHWHGRLPQPPS